jgi:hypothetical protein
MALARANTRRHELRTDALDGSYDNGRDTYPPPLPPENPWRAPFRLPRHPGRLVHVTMVM